MVSAIQIEGDDRMSIFSPTIAIPISRIAAFVGLFLTTSAATWADILPPLWHGVGIQGSESNWSVEVDMTKTKPTVSYPSLKCSGEWQKLTSSNGIDEYREVIIVGRQNCIDGYARVFRISKTRMGVEYSESQGGPLIAKAVIFPGKSHEDTKAFMYGVTKRFIAETKK
jgi:hypothetical protein